MLKKEAAKKEVFFFRVINQMSLQAKTRKRGKSSFEGDDEECRDECRETCGECVVSAK
jgi:hypothetical protein